MFYTQGTAAKLDYGIMSNMLLARLTEVSQYTALWTYDRSYRRSCMYR